MYQLRPVPLIKVSQRYKKKFKIERGPEVEWKLNNRPRKSLGYLTPLEYFKKV